ncbi:MAG: HRDC domain-containing protein [Bacteroidota bacterium]
MKVRIFSFPFQPSLGGFDTYSLEKFCLDKEVLELNAHFFQQENQAYWTVYVRYRLPLKEKVGTTHAEQLLSEKDQLLLRRLKEYRGEKAKELGWPPFLVFTKDQMMAFVNQKVSTLEGFGPIKGFGAKKTQRFGKDILEIIRAFQTEKS